MKKHLTLFLIILSLSALTLCSPGSKKNISWGFTLDGFPITEEKLTTLQQETGVPSPGYIVFFLQWAKSTQKSYEMQCSPLRKTLQNVHDIGAIPCLTWEPMQILDGKRKDVLIEEIIQGRYDKYLTEVALTIKKHSHPVMIRFAHEMNTPQYHWGITPPSLTSSYPQKYKAMFRYLVDFFQKLSVKNALWVFCPNAESISLPSNKKTTWNNISNYYPGDTYIDILGVDGYNWGDFFTEEKHGWKSSWRSFENVFEEAVATLKALSPQKPLLVFETASPPGKTMQQRSIWIKEGITAAQRWNIQGISWFQVDKEMNWKINEDEGKIIKKMSSHKSLLEDSLTSKRSL
jgi:mannan endo-1,4-beta-mannosidase